MDLQIRIDGRSVTDYVELIGILNGNRNFRGRVRPVTDTSPASIFPAV